MQLDFGFGDVVTPAPQEVEYPVLLDMPPPRLRGYPPETFLAEKLQTMVEKGLLNSRIKDYYDVWMLSRWCKFNPEMLGEAISRTFDQRGSKMQLSVLTQLLREYGKSEERQHQWERFCRKNSLSDIEQKSLSEVCTSIEDFVNQTLAN